MHWSKKGMLLLAAMVSIGLLAGCGSEAANKSQKVYKIGIVQLMDHQALDDTRKGFIAGLADRGYKEGVNIQLDLQNAHGDQSTLQTIARRFLHEEDDLIAAITTTAAQAMAKATKKVPIVGMTITDFEAAKLVASNAHPGGNVTGVSNKMPAEKHVALLQAILPHAKEIGVMYTSSEVNAEVQVRAFEKVAEAAGLKLKIVTVSSVNDIRQATESLVNAKVDAIWIPTDNVIASAYPNLFQVTNAAHIPVFPSERNALEAGALAMYSIDYYDVGYQGGQMAADILEGKSKPADMPIQRPDKLNLYVNWTAAKALGISIPDAIKNAATQG